MAAVKAWKLSDPKAPPFPDDFEIVNTAVLQVTDIKSNHNKYYAIEVHQGVAAAGGGSTYRVFTHYGRTDDLDSNPDAGQRECRYFDTLAEAQGTYQAIYREKTSSQKGYKELSLASSRIGSAKARGHSSGQIDDQTLEKAAKAKAAAAAAAAPPSAAHDTPTELAAVAVPSTEATASEHTTTTTSAPPTATTTAAAAPSGWRAKLAGFFGQRVPGADPADLPRSVPMPPVAVSPDNPGAPLDPTVAELVEMIYAEATSALTSTVAAKITAQGIETPLGILTLGQITKGEAILQELYAVFQKKKGTAKIADQLAELSGEFYTVIPHRIGRTRAAAQAAIINTLEAFEQKQETLQLMKDMLEVNGEGNVLYFSQSRAQYEALRCTITPIASASDTFREIRDYVVSSQVKSKSVKVQRVFALRREHEWTDFAESIDNQRLLFHGSRIKNWVGILSRGILLPKIVVSLGVNRTDAGWLGNGIYFGDAACTSAFYTTPSRKGTRLMSVARVALGATKEFTKITYGLAGPPPGYDSCHGVRNRAGRPSQFADDEYVVYRTNQQRLEYLVEFRL